MNRLSVREAFSNSARVFSKNFLIVLFIAIIAGGLRDVVVTSTVGAVAGTFKDLQGRPLLVATQLGQLALGILWGCIVGSWAAPAAIYLWVQEEKQKEATLYEAVNFGLARFKRVVGPHSLAFFFIQLGSIIIVPQILLGIQYAFVDAIATLDAQEKEPLRRSRRLTTNRRQTVFFTFLPFLPWWIAYVALSYIAMNSSVAYTFAGGMVDHMVLIFLDLCMVQYYLDLFRERPQAQTS